MQLRRDSETPIVPVEKLKLVSKHSRVMEQDHRLDPVGSP
jgi:hypothetical protein